MKHLSNKTYEFVINSSSEDRIKFLFNTRWIRYSRSTQILDRMKDLLDYPQCSRMPNILLVGNTNNGKTALIEKFSRSFPAYVRESDEKVILPVLLIQAPYEPDEKKFFNIILERLHAPILNSEKPDRKQMRIIHLFRELNIRLFIIDEIHHVLSGTPTKQRLFLNLLKYLSNELRISIVCSGTRDAFNVIQSDPQLANRFEPKVLPNWAQNDEYLQLLTNFEALLPLKNASYLTEYSLSSRILMMSEGLIGEISTILTRGAKLAIETGIECISHKILDNIDYITPENRKKAIRQLNG